MVIGIIGAMDLEISGYLGEIKLIKKIAYANLIFYVGKINSKKVVIVKSGAGKVNSALCAQILIDKFCVSAIIFTGVAGALNKSLNVFDVVVLSDCIQHDIDATALGFEIGEIPFSKMKTIPSSKALSKLALTSAKDQNLKVILGKGLTGDQFISSEEKNNYLREKFGGDCVDMESAAVAYVCFVNKIPFVIIRTISDGANSSAKISFNVFFAQAAEHSKNIVLKMLEKM